MAFTVEYARVPSDTSFVQHRVHDDAETSVTDEKVLTTDQATMEWFWFIYSTLLGHESRLDDIDTPLTGALALLDARVTALEGV